MIEKVVYGSWKRKACKPKKEYESHQNSIHFLNTFGTNLDVVKIA
jgi:hypothetical protein